MTLTNPEYYVKKINFVKFVKIFFLVEVHNLFVFCLTNKVQIKYYIP